jgi:ferredoxin
MALRHIINIEEEKCNGCGQCIVECAEAALQIVNGKAKLVSEIYCDGLGACIGNCPTGALTIVQRESDPFDEEATGRHIKEISGKNEESCACPSTRTVDFTAPGTTRQKPNDIRPELANWPIQLKLVATKAPYFEDAALLLAADCTAFSTVNFHSGFIRGKKLLIACPKLDDAQLYFEKLTEIFRDNAIKSISVIRMEVPCCGGLSHIVKQALQKSGKDLPFSEVVIGIKGDILSEEKPPLIP